jgi:hypothetical protein
LAQSNQVLTIPTLQLLTEQGKMATMLASRGVFAARTVAPVKAVMCSPLSSRAVMPVVPRMGQSSSFMGGESQGTEPLALASGQKLAPQGLWQIWL